MREIDINSLVNEKTKLEITQRKKQEYKLVLQNTIIPHDNHILYEIDLKTLKVVEAKFLQKDYVFNPFWKKGDKLAVNSDVIVKQGCAYVSSMNKENALKKLKKGSNGTRIDKTKTYLEL